MISLQYHAMLLPTPASQAGLVLEQDPFPNMQKKHFYAGLVVVSWFLYQSRYLKLPEVLSLRVSARADVPENIR